jgi:hypothetical protein
LGSSSPFRKRLISKSSECSKAARSISGALLSEPELKTFQGFRFGFSISHIAYPFGTMKPMRRFQGNIENMSKARFLFNWVRLQPANLR